VLPQLRERLLDEGAFYFHGLAAGFKLLPMSVFRDGFRRQSTRKSRLPVCPNCAGDRNSAVQGHPCFTVLSQPISKCCGVVQHRPISVVVDRFEALCPFPRENRASFPTCGLAPPPDPPIALPTPAGTGEPAGNACAAMLDKAARPAAVMRKNIASTPLGRPPAGPPCLVSGIETQSASGVIRELGPRRRTRDCARQRRASVGLASRHVARAYVVGPSARPRLSLDHP